MLYFIFTRTKRNYFRYNTFAAFGFRSVLLPQNGKSCGTVFVYASHHVPAPTLRVVTGNGLVYETHQLQESYKESSLDEVWLGR